MSVKWLRRGWGIKLTCCCGGVLQTAQVQAAGIRVYAKTIGWGRGLLKGRKRFDLCPTCMPIERAAFAAKGVAWEAEKLRRDEVKKAKLSATPKKPRKPRGEGAA